MVFVTVLFALSVLPLARSVKVMIDGTIDFGPNWNFRFKHTPISGLEPRKRISNNVHVLVNSVTIAPGNDDITADIVEDIDKNNDRDEAVTGAEEDRYTERITTNEERIFEVTKLHKTHVKDGLLFKNPRKIKDKIDVVTFIKQIKNDSLKMFDDVREKLNDSTIGQKIIELKERYINKYGEFENETMNHTIRTTLGNKKVILNTIDYSNRLLDRLVNRFTIDLEDSGLRSSYGKSTKLKKHIDNLKIRAYENACRSFSACRTGNEFSDHISELITILLKQDDVKLQLTVKAVAKVLKSATFNKIMDKDTQRAFKNGLSTLEELNPFELRVVLMAYKIIIENRHKPFLNSDPNNPWVKATVAMYHVMEGFNKKIIIDTKDWKSIKKDFERWFTRDEGDIQDIAKRFVDQVQGQIEALDEKSANDFKAKLRLCILVKALRVNLTSYLQFQQFAA